MTSKCKTCGHTFHIGLCDAFMTGKHCKCEKFEGEDVPHGSPSYTNCECKECKQQKGCGCPHNWECPSCSTQSPLSRKIKDTPEEKETCQLLYSKSSGNQSPQVNSNKFDRSVSNPEDTKTLSDKILPTYDAEGDQGSIQVEDVKTFISDETQIINDYIKCKIGLDEMWERRIKLAGLKLLEGGKEK